MPDRVDPFGLPIQYKGEIGRRKRSDPHLSSGKEIYLPTMRAEKGFLGNVYFDRKRRSELVCGLALLNITSPSYPLSGGLRLAADVDGPTS